MRLNRLVHVLCLIVLLISPILYPSFRTWDWLAFLILGVIVSLAGVDGNKPPILIYTIILVFSSWFIWYRMDSLSTITSFPSISTLFNDTSFKTQRIREFIAIAIVAITTITALL